MSMTAWRAVFRSGLRTGLRRRVAGAATAAAFVGVSLPAVPAAAQDIPEEIEITAAMRRAYIAVAPYCAADARRLCSEVVAGNGRVTRCVIENIENLSPVCKAKVTERLAELWPE